MAVRTIAVCLVNSNGWHGDGNAGLGKTWIYSTMHVHA